MSALKLAVPEVPKAPELIPVFTFNLKLASDPASIYVNNESDKTLNLATIANGEVKTVPNKLGLELDIHSIYGTDDLNIKNSVSTASLDCKLYGKTANGSGVFIYYPGKVNWMKLPSPFSQRKPKKLQLKIVMLPVTQLSISMIKLKTNTNGF